VGARVRGVEKDNVVEGVRGGMCPPRDGEVCAAPHRKGASYESFALNPLRFWLIFSHAFRQQKQFLGLKVGGFWGRM